MPNFVHYLAASGARRPVATTVVKNPLVADSSRKESSCGDSMEILRCPTILPYMVP